MNYRLVAVPVETITNEIVETLCVYHYSGNVFRRVWHIWQPGDFNLSKFWQARVGGGAGIFDIEDGILYRLLEDVPTENEQKLLNRIAGLEQAIAEANRERKLEHFFTVNARMSELYQAKLDLLDEMIKRFV